MYWSLFLDDERFPTLDPNKNWIIARTFDQAVDLVRVNGMPNFVSFDHDLGEDLSGYDFAQYICGLDQISNDFRNKFPHKFDYYVHSQNPVGKKNIECFMDNYLKFKGVK